MSKIIKLTKGYETIVDDEDYEELSKHKWYANVGGTAPHLVYARGTINGKKVRMHRVIMKTTENLVVDHKNHDTLDNRKKNLRNCTQKENQENRPK